MLGRFGVCYTFEFKESVVSTVPSDVFLITSRRLFVVEDSTLTTVALSGREGLKSWHRRDFFWESSQNWSRMSSTKVWDYFTFFKLLPSWMGEMSWLCRVALPASACCSLATFKLPILLITIFSSHFSSPSRFCPLFCSWFSFQHFAFEGLALALTKSLL